MPNHDNFSVRHIRVLLSLEKYALHRGRTDRISLIHDLGL